MPMEGTMRKSFQLPGWLCLPAIGAGVVLALTAHGASATPYTYTTLHAFCRVANCADGQHPMAGLLIDAAGDLYGTTRDGGKYGYGLVFKLIPNADKTKYTEHILKSFCAHAGCPEGSHPAAELIMDADGNLYGTALGGGKYGNGVAFKMKPVANGWSYAAIHSFCHDTNCTDGRFPDTGFTYAGQASGAPWDGSSPLFATTNSGGANNMGSVYELRPAGSGWTYQVIHSFSSGFFSGPVVMTPSGDLFGVTTEGGKYGDGTLFRLAAGTWSEATLHNFCAETNCTDGYYPYGRLAVDAAGNLFGTASQGGSGQLAAGVAFEYTPGSGYSVIYNFCSRQDCGDGSNPAAGMIMDAGGNLLGTTTVGGKREDGGTAFMLSHGSGWTEQVLHSFCGNNGTCKGGTGLGSPLVLDQSGNLFGTIMNDGAYGDGGSVFELSP